MSEAPEQPRCSEPERELHRRLRDGDRLAPSDLATSYLGPLVEFLQRQNRDVDAHLCGEAAEDAILALVRNPNSYQPGRASLRGYLQMSAQGDLKNILSREEKHRNVVELPENDGKYLGVQDRTSAPTDGDGKMQRRKAIVDREAEKLSEPDRRVLELMQRGERRTSVYAEVCGKTHLPPKEQAREVKRAKDRVKAQLKRAGERDELTS